MTAYLLDTNIISLFLRNHKLVRLRFIETIKPDDIVYGCPVVWFEVRRGLLKQDAKRQISTFEAFFQTLLWQDYTRDDWTLAGELWSQRQAKGLPIADADLLIAVFAINRNAVLVTDNEKDFVELGLTIENWTQD